MLHTEEDNADRSCFSKLDYETVRPPSTTSVAPVT
jgi:hypothetical protein